MANKLVIGNNKGGVGKTMSTINIAGCLSKYYGKKVLVVDCDPSGNLTSVFIRDENGEYIDPNWKDKACAFILALRNYVSTGSVTEDAVSANVVHTRFPNIDLLPIPSKDESKKGQRLIEGIAKLQNEAGEETNTDIIYRQFFDDVEDDYDYIIFDLPAGVDGLYCINALCVADLLLAPISSDGDSISGGMLAIREMLNKARPNNPKIALLGLFRSGCKDVSQWRETDKLFEQLPDGYKVPVKIRYSEILIAAKNKCLPACYYREKTAACEDFVLLTEYVMRSFSDNFEGKKEV